MTQYDWPFTESSVYSAFLALKIYQIVKNLPVNQKCRWGVFNDAWLIRKQPWRQCHSQKSCFRCHRDNQNGGDSGE